MSIFDQVFFQASVTDDQSMRDAEQIGIGKFNARPRIAIVEQDFDSGLLQLCIEFFRGSAYVDISNIAKALVTMEVLGPPKALRDDEWPMR